MMLGAVTKLGMAANAVKAGHGDSTQQSPQIIDPPKQQKKTAPSDAIFNTQFTTAGKRFLTKIKKNRAMQVDRRTRGFQLGLDHRTIVIDPFTGNHYRVLIVDPDMTRREHLADNLEQHFEIFVSPSNERAFTLLGLFAVNFVLLYMDIGNDQTATTSPALAFLREMKRGCFRIPVAALVAPTINSDHEVQKLLARALQQSGICGYFEEGLPPEIMTERLAKLLRSLTVAQNELARCRGQSETSKDTPTTTKAAANRNQPHSQKQPNQSGRKTPPSSAAGLKAPPPVEVPTTRPSSIKYDRPGMLLELSLNQRKQCNKQREALTSTLTLASHSVLGVDIGSNPLLSPGPSTPLSTCLSPTINCAGRSTKVDKKIPPLPSSKQISRLIYTRPQELQNRIGRHLYEREHISGPPGPVPQDPLLHHCVVIDPRPQGRNLVVGKAYMLYCEQRLDEAMVHCERSLRTPNPTLEKLARLLRGALYDARGEHNRAESEFLACIELDPSVHEAFFNLSVARLKLGKDELALKDLTQALALDPQNEKYLNNRGLMYRRMGLFAQAQTEYTKRDAATAPTSSGHRNIHVMQRTRLGKCEMEDGLFAHLFGKPTLDKLALTCPATERTLDMLNAIVSRLQTLLFFQDFPREILTQVAQDMDYDVVACGKSFALGEAHPQNFYVLLGGRLSVRRRVGTTDFGSFVTTHHLGTGTVFGCAGFAVSSQASLIADECAEIGLLWPDAYAATIRAVTSQTNQDVFAFLQQLRGFRRLTTSELGHIVGISERKRFRKGDVLLQQNEHPKYLAVLWKGSCSVYQDFNSPPLCRRKVGDDDDYNSDDDESDEEDDNWKQRRSHNNDDGSNDPGTPPFHHLMSKPDWPLGFQARTRARKYRRGRRDGLLLLETPLVVPQVKLSMSLPKRRTREKLPARDKNALVQTCVSPAVFGESSFLVPARTSSKCSVAADSLVEVLLFDHMRLQEMDLHPEMISELMDAAPKYLSEKEIAQKQGDVATWDEYKNLRLLELSKKRWPEAKKHLRTLSNGCSIMLTDTTSPSSSPKRPNSALSPIEIGTKTTKLVHVSAVS